MTDPAPDARPSRDFLIALGAFALVLIWLFKDALLHGYVPDLGARPPVAQAIRGLGEQSYQLLATLWSQSRIVRDGVFPAWTPFPHGGTPLLGKLMNGVFSPFHLPYYLLSEAAKPHATTLALALQAFFTLVFTYLFARSVRLGKTAAIFAALSYLFAPRALGSLLFAPWPSALYLPLILLLIEAHFRRKRGALLLLPWAVALSFFSGHFESALRGLLAAGVYFLFHLYRDPAPLEEKQKRLLAFAAACAAGLAVAGVQIQPGMDYVNFSYNKVWRSLPEFAWDLHTVNKHLSAEDIPLIALGWGAVGLFAFLFKKHAAAAPAPFSGRSLLLKALCALSLAAAGACLANVGLDDSLSPLQDGPIGLWWLDIFRLFLALWAWTRPGASPGRKALGWIFLASVLVQLRTPPFASVLLHLPVFKLLYNTMYVPEYDLARAVLCAFALQEAAALYTKNRDERKTAAGAALLWLCAGLLAYPLCRPLKERLTAAVDTSAQSSGPGDRAPGGIMGPEKGVSYADSIMVAGWLPASPQVQSVLVGVLVDNQVKNSAQAKISFSGGRQRFAAKVPFGTENDIVRVMAQVHYPGGGQRILRGPEILVTRRPFPRDFLPALIAAALLFLAGGWLPAPATAAYGALACWKMLQSTLVFTPAGLVPFPLAGIAKIKEDTALHRVGSVPYNLLAADYPTLYGLYDVRGGGDNLDVLTMINFLHFNYSMLGQSDPKAQEHALKLLGLANVKYLLDYPEASVPNPSLVAVHRGEEMTVWRNPHAAPRASFFEDFHVLPVADPFDWRSRGETFGRMNQLLNSPGFDPQRTLLLNDKPPAWLEEARVSMRSTGKPPKVEIEVYRPDYVRIQVAAPRPGLVLLSDNLLPGWHASVNGQEKEILRSWLTFRAVGVPAGPSTVEFRYRPTMLYVALFLSAGAGLCLLIAYALRRKGPPAPVPAPPPEKGKKKTREKAAEAALDVDPAADHADALGGRLLLSLVGSLLAFWAAWAAFICAGGVQNGWKG